MRLWVSAPDAELQSIAVSLVEMALGLVLSFRQEAGQPRNPLGAFVELGALELDGDGQLIGEGTVTWSPAFGDGPDAVERLRVVFNLLSLRKHRVSYSIATAA